MDSRREDVRKPERVATPERFSSIRRGWKLKKILVEGTGVDC